MAEIEQKRIITIDAAQSIRTLRELRTALEESRKSLAGLDKSAENYDKELVQSKRLQSDYNAALRLAVKESKAAAGSYDALTVQLAKLKQQWKATGDEAERARLTKEINQVKGKLNEMDHSIGNWQRNVGNYWGSIKGGMVGATAAITAAIAIFRKGAQTLTRVVNSTQAAGDSWKITMAATTAATEQFFKALSVGDFAGFTANMREAMVAARELTAALDEAFERTNSINLQRAKASKEMADLERSFRDTGKDTNTRIADLDTYIAKIEAFAAQDNAVNQDLRDRWLDRLATSAKVAKADREAFASRLETYELDRKMLDEAKAYNIALSQQAAQRSGVAYTADEIREFTDVINSARPEVVAFAEFLNQYKLTNDEIVKGYIDAEIKYQQGVTAAYNENRRLYTLRDTLVAGQQKKDAENTAKAVENAKKREAARQAELDAFIKAVEAESQALVEADLRAEQAANRSRSTRNAGTLGAVDKWASGQEVSARAEIDDERQLQARLYEIRQQADAKKLELLRRFAQEAKDAQDLAGQLAYEQQAADLAVEITQKEVTEKARLRRQEQADIKATTKAAINATTQMLGNVASAYQASIDARVQSGKISEEQAAKEYEQVKALQIAQTWINALAGSIAIWSNTDPSPYWVKAVQSAAIITQGIAATQQIKATSRGSATSNAFNAVQAAPVVLNAPAQTRTVTSASDEQRLNERASTQRVVLVWSDVQAMNKKVEITQAESQF